MITASCPQCASRIDIQANPEVGLQLRCPNCQTALVVTWLYPVCLDFLDESHSNQPETGQQPEAGKPPA